MLAATNVSIFSQDSNWNNPGGVVNNITWTDSASTGTFTYTVKRNTTNSLAGAVPVGTNIPAGRQNYTDSTVTPGTRYYYFVEVTDGTNTTVSNSAEVTTVLEKGAMTNQYRSLDADALVYDPTTDSFM